MENELCRFPSTTARILVEYARGDLYHIFEFPLLYKIPEAFFMDGIDSSQPYKIVEGHEVEMEGDSAMLCCFVGSGRLLFIGRHDKSLFGCFKVLSR